MDIVIETLRGSRAKFNYDIEKGCFAFRKMLPLGMAFPFDFGFIPGTIGQDGNPLDAVIISEVQTFTGCHIDCRLIGCLQAQQQGGGTTIGNNYYLFVPEGSIEFRQIDTFGQIPRQLIHELEAFFVQYNELESKKFKVIKWTSAKDALAPLEMAKQDVPASCMVQLFLPYFDPDGRQFPRSYYNGLKQQLVEKFGGISMYEQAPITGLWKENEQAVQRDRLMIFEVMATTIDVDYWRALKEKLQKKFRQQEVLIRRMNIGVVK